MKIAILFLILVNVVFMSWSRWVAETPHERQVATPEPPAEALVLFAEKYPARAEAERAEAERAEAERAEAERAEADATGPAPATPDGELDVEAAAFAPVEAGEAVAPPAGEAEPQSEVEPPPDDEQARAMIDAAVAESAAATPEPLVAMSDDGPATARCVKLGPFLSLREATGAAARLRSVDLLPTQRLEEAKVWVGHWVHLPPYPSRAEAIAVVEKLRADGVSDIYIEPSGDMRNAISLGLFSDAEGAEIRAGKVRRLGVKPQIRDRFRDGSVYWVDFELPPGRDLDPAQFGSAPNREIELVERPCAATG